MTPPRGTYMNQTSLRTATLALLLAGGSTTAPAAVVYTQPPQSPVVSVRASQFLASSGGFTFQTFDNFSRKWGKSPGGEA